MYNRVEYWDNPVDIIESKPDYISEMSRTDHLFVCGLIKEFRPHKMVEIGVAEGGGTALIALATTILGLNTEIYSVDICENYYRDASKKTGYYFEGKIGGGVKHKYMLGKTIAGQIEMIGSGIDMAIIDTTYSMPGEFLDFLAIYPYLKPDSVVILHDVNLNQANIEDLSNYSRVVWRRNAACTKYLFGTVGGDKYINFGPKGEIPNIAGFKINEMTEPSIMDVFWGLTLTWDYMPSDWQLEEYRRLFRLNYDEEALNLFEQSIILNRNTNNRFEESKKLLAQKIVKAL